MFTEYLNKRLNALPYCLFLYLLGILYLPASGQQIKLNPGTYLNYSGNYVVINGKLNNSGTITTSGLNGITADGDWFNNGTYSAGNALHKVGGNFTNDGIFNAQESTVTFNGTIVQTIGGMVPITFNNMIIDNSAGVTLVTDSLYTVSGNLIINPEKRLEISPGKRLTVNRMFNNNGILNLKSDETSMFSLMMNSYSGTGIANISIYLTGGGAPAYKWHYVAVPVNYTNDKTVFTSVNALNLLRYDESRIPDGESNYKGWQWHDGYNEVTGEINSADAFYNLDIWRGYNFYHNDLSGFAYANFTNLSSLQTSFGSVALQYSGLNKTTPLNYGFNLLGNSLTCGIDWDLVTETTGDINDAVFYTISGKVGSYIRNVAGINDATNYIPPMQGFFVKSYTPGAQLDFSVAKVHSSQQRYKGKNTANVPLIRLELNNLGRQDETLVWFNEKATNFFDSNFDASKLFSSESGYDQIYSWFGTEKFGINGIPFPRNETTIPLAVKFLHAGSDYRIIASQLYGLDDYKVTLTDKWNADLTVNLKNTDRYIFSSEAGLFNDRFFLTITNLLTDIPEKNRLEKAFNIFAFDKILNIELLSYEWEGRSSIIKIYDLAGCKVLQQNKVEWYKGERKQIPFDVMEGLYIVEIKAEKQRFVSKIVIL